MIHSEIKFDEKFVSVENETTTFYFTAPKEMLNGAFPEADSATLSVEFPTGHCFARNSTVMLSPKKNNSDYAWQDIELPDSDIDDLISLAENSDCLNRIDTLRNHCEEMFDQAYSEESEEWDECISALDKARKHLSCMFLTGKDAEKANALLSTLLNDNFLERCYDALAGYLNELGESAAYLRLDDELECNQKKTEQVTGLMTRLWTAIQLQGKKEGVEVCEYTMQNV